MEMMTAAGTAAAPEAIQQARGPRVSRRGNPTLTLLAVALGVMMVALDGTIVAVANPAIQSHLHASLADIQWVTNAYLLALAVSLITMGKIGDRFGHKKVFITGVTGFARMRRCCSVRMAMMSPCGWSTASLAAPLISLIGSPVAEIVTRIKAMTVLAGGRPRPVLGSPPESADGRGCG